MQNMFSVHNEIKLDIQLKDSFSSAQSCSTLCDHMDCSTPGFPVHHQLLEFTQTHPHELVMPSNHLIFCLPLLLWHSIFPSMRWPKLLEFQFQYQSFQ